MEKQFEFDISKIKKTSLDMFCHHILEGFSLAMEDENFVKKCEEYREDKSNAKKRNN